MNDPCDDVRHWFRWLSPYKKYQTLNVSPVPGTKGFKESMDAMKGSSGFGVVGNIFTEQRFPVVIHHFPPIKK